MQHKAHIICITRRPYASQGTQLCITRHAICITRHTKYASQGMQYASQGPHIICITRHTKYASQGTQLCITRPPYYMHHKACNMHHKAHSNMHHKAHNMHHKAHNNMHHKATIYASQGTQLCITRHTICITRPPIICITRPAICITRPAICITRPFAYASQGIGTHIICITRRPYYMHHKAPILYASQKPHICCTRPHMQHKAPIINASQGPHIICITGHTIICITRPMAHELVHLPEDLISPEGVARLAETILHKAPILYASQGAPFICITRRPYASQGTR